MLDVVMDAILGGVAAAAGKVTTSAVQDAYTGIKSLISHKHGEHSDAADAIAKLEDKPDSNARKAVLAEEIGKLDIVNDVELVAAAKRLHQALNDLPAEHKVYVQEATGNYIAQASTGGRAAVNVGNSILPKES